MEASENDDEVNINGEPIEVKEGEPKHGLLQSRTTWLPINMIKENFSRENQHGQQKMGLILQKSAIPAIDILRREEGVIYDAVNSGAPAVDNGAKIAIIFAGTCSVMPDVYDNTLENHAREWGAMERLLSDGETELNGTRCQDFLYDMEPNELGCWKLNFSRTMIKAYEKVYAIPGLNYGELEGRMLNVWKELYVLKSGRVSWPTLHDVLFWKGPLGFGDADDPSEREKGSVKIYTNMNLNEWYPQYSRSRVARKSWFPHSDTSRHPKDHVSNTHEHHHLFTLIGHSSNFSRLNLTRYRTAI